MRGGIVGWACLAGLVLVVAGLYVRSPLFLDFAAARISPDGVLDPYTLEQAADFSSKIILAGLLVPVVAILAPLALGANPGWRWGALFGGCALLLVVVLYLWLVNVTPYYAANLRTLGDEVQYAIPAVNLLTRGRLVMIMNGIDFPPISPFGFHLVLLPFYWLFGPMVGNGIRAVQASAVLALAATFALACMAVGKRRAILTTVLLAANPLFIWYTIRIMQATTRLAFILVGLFLVLLIWRTRRRSAVLLISALLGFLSGFLCLIAFTSVLIAPVLLVVMVYVIREKRERAAIPVLLFLLAASATMVPLLLYNSAVFGSWHATGYHAWLWSRPPEGGHQFSAVSAAPRDYDVILLQGLSKLGWEGSVRPLMARFIDLAGLGKVYNLSVFILFLLGLWNLKMGRISLEYKALILFLLLFLLVNVPAYALVSFSSPRYFLPLIPVVLIICSDAFLTCFAGASGRARSLKRISLCILLAFSMAGVASLVREKLLVGRPFPYRYEMARAYGRVIDGDAVIISGIDGVYMGHFCADGEDVVWFPVSSRVHFARQGERLLFPPASESIPIIREYLSRGKPVYIDDLREASYPEAFRKLGDAFLFERILNVNGYAIYRLRERPSAG